MIILWAHYSKVELFGEGSNARKGEESYQQKTITAAIEMPLEDMQDQDGKISPCGH